MPLYEQVCVFLTNVDVARLSFRTYSNMFHLAVAVETGRNKNADKSVSLICVINNDHTVDHTATTFSSLSYQTCLKNYTVMINNRMLSKRCDPILSTASGGIV